jgi:outer membrane protein OmpA-like peptidoglycan-associated protein
MPRLSRLGLPLVVAVAALSAVPPAVAQPNPTADQLIESLRPRGPGGVTTRGIRPGGGGAAPAEAPRAAPVPVAPPVAAPGAPAAVPPARPPQVVAPTQPPVATDAPPSVNLSVQFATGSAELTPSAIRTLDQLGMALSSQALSSFRFRIEGHTDTVGSRELNQALSERRAAAVRNYLMQRHGIAADRLEAIGRGQEALLVPTGDNVPEPRNRRVQVTNLDG